MTMPIKYTNNNMVNMIVSMIFLGKSTSLPAVFNVTRLINSIRKDPLSNLNSKQTRAQGLFVKILNRMELAKINQWIRIFNFYIIYYKCLIKLKPTTYMMMKLQERMEQKL